VQDQVGALRRLEDGRRVFQVRPLLRRLGHGYRVVHGHDRPLGHQVIADGDAGRIPDVVAVGLERDAEHGHPSARQRASRDFPGQLDHPVPAADVDGVHGGQQADHGVHAQF
jgi:hypothetical protein